MKLQEAIEYVLWQYQKPLSPKVIAEEINAQSLYFRKDGNSLPSNQVSARVKNYPTLFIKKDHLIYLSNWSKEEAPVSMDKVKQFEKNEGNKQLKGNPLMGKFLVSQGFTYLGEIGNLIEKGLPENENLYHCGIYAVTIGPNMHVKFIPKEKARGNVIHPWSIEDLQSKWVNNCEVIYYGLAGNKKPRSLRARINDLLKHCNGNISKSGPHKGGEIIWQIKGYENFGVWALSTSDPPSPRNLEIAILQKYKRECGALPFGNRRL